LAEIVLSHVYVLYNTNVLLADHNQLL
jgi:hypothetical protein